MRLVMRSVASVCVYTYTRVCLSVCPVRALTFESLDLETSLLIFGNIFRISTGEVRLSRSSDQGQGHRSKMSYEHNYTQIFAGGSPSIERQPCDKSEPQVIKTSVQIEIPLNCIACPMQVKLCDPCLSAL